VSVGKNSSFDYHGFKGRFQVKDDILKELALENKQRAGPR